MTDDMVKLVARAMEEQDKARKRMKNHSDQMRAKALGLMEFTKAELRSLEERKLQWNDIIEDLWTETEELFDQ